MPDDHRGEEEGRWIKVCRACLLGLGALVLVLALGISRALTSKPKSD